MSGRRVGIAEVLALATVSDPRWSPDGRLIACSVSRPDLAVNRERSAIWLVDPDGATPAKQLTAGTSRRPPSPLLSRRKIARLRLEPVGH